jgi:phosphoglycolate phosphatase
MGYTHCIWDFNGTVLNDMSAGIRAVNELLSKRNLPLISGIEEYRNIFGFPVKSYYEALGFDFSKEPYDKIAHEWVALYLEYVKECSLCDGVYETLDKLKARGLTQVLLSATERDMLMRQVNDLGLKDSFSEILGLDNIYAVSKLSMACDWRKSNIDIYAFMIGDTEHDCDVAKAMGVDCYLVCSGHQSRQKLERLGVPVFDSLFELTAFLEEKELI